MLQKVRLLMITFVAIDSQSTNLRRQKYIFHGCKNSTKLEGNDTRGV